MSWNSNKSITFNKEGKNIMLSGQESIKNPQFLALNSEKGIQKAVAKNDSINVLSSKFSWAGVYSSLTTGNSKESSSGVDSKFQDTSMMDSKLGRFPEKKDAQSSMPRKRAKPENSNPQTPFCQVEGCDKDLTASKDYNKRHKVCEIHSKTAKVYVKGVEQRFCQQCSRFHSLSEFDDGKRSCRKRLAGHNERRRKNHAIYHLSRKLIPPYTGTNFVQSSYAASYVSPNVLQRNHFYPPQKHEINNWNRIPSTSAAAASYGIPVTRTVENDRYMSSSDFDSLSLYHQNTPVEDPNILNGSSSFRGQPQKPPSSSSCALSLLSSSQSQTHQQHPLYVSSTIPPTSRYGIVQISGNPKTNSVDETNMESLLITDSMGSYNKFIPGSSSAGGGNYSTVDLLELSSQLHNVENQRQSMQMKLDDDDDPFFGLKIT